MEDVIKVLEKENPPSNISVTVLWALLSSYGIHLVSHVIVRFRSIEAMQLAGQLSCRSVLIGGRQVAVGFTVTAFQFLRCFFSETTRHFVSKSISQCDARTVWPRYCETCDTLPMLICDL